MEYRYGSGRIYQHMGQWRQGSIMKTQRDAIAAALGLVLGVAAMAGMLTTDLYAQAAGAEARGEQALIKAVAPQYCADGARGPTLLAAEEARP